MKKQPKRIPMYAQIQDYINDQLMEQRWKPGDTLPSENQLSSQFQVSRITVKKALANLIEEGLIFRVQGKGTFVANDPEGEPMLYRPTATAEENAPMVAFLMPRLNNLYTAQLLSAIETEVSQQGYKLLFCKTNDSQEQEKKLLRELAGMGVKGIIIYPADGETYNEEILKMTMTNYPLVVTDRYLRGIETNSVYFNNIEGAYEAVSCLINQGHSKIGLISTSVQGTTSIEDRISGYERAFAEHGIPIEHRLWMTHFQTEKMNEILETGMPNEDYREELKQYLIKNPDLTAVFAINSSIGQTVFESALQIGLRIPEDLSITFFDNEITTLAKVGPAFVSQDAKKLGQEAAKLLISVIDNPKQERKKIVISPRLISKS